MILNKVHTSKHAYIAEFARRGLARLGIDLLGVIPEVSVLAEPTLAQVSEAVGGEFMHAVHASRRHVSRVIHRGDEQRQRRGAFLARHPGGDPG